MGDRLGWAIFLLVFFAADFIITLSFAENNTSCQSDCLRKEDEAIPCQATENPGCTVPGEITGNEVTKVTRPLVDVTGISVTQTHSSQYVVALRWTPLSVTSNATRRLWVRWQAFESDEDCNGSLAEPATATSSSPSTHCQTLDFLHSPSTISYIAPTQWCYQTANPHRCHNVTIADYPKNISLTFTVKMPNNLTVIDDPGSGSEWETPVGIAVVTHIKHQSVIAVIQAAPPELNITSYQLTLVDTHNGFNDDEKILSENETVYIFEDVSKNGTYEVRVEPLGPGCSPRCRLSKSAVVNIAEPVKVVPPSTLTHSSTTSSTTMTATPASTNPSTTPNDISLHKTTKATDPSVIVKPAMDQHEYTKSRNIILGTVFGALVLAIVATIIFCIYRRTRNVRPGSFQMHPFGTHRESNSSIILEDQLKNQPIVLLLYSYDCPAHEVVVTTFAYFLKEVANCEVILDIWDQHNIQEQGVYAWLVDKVDVAQFIIMICSTGARFKCARNRQVRMKHDRTLPDVFAWGVDHVAEKIRTSANTSEAKSRYLSAYFDYAGKSDIPPKLEITKKFRLMKDMYSLYCHLHGLKPNGSHGKHGLTVDTYSKTEEGRSLQDALIDAKHFFKDNPDWLGQTLETVTPVLSPSRELTSVKPQNGSGGRRMPVSPSTGSDKDSLLEERMKKRMREQEEIMDRRSMPKKEELVAPPYSTPGTSPSHMASDSSSSVTSMSPLVSPVVALKSPPQVPSSTYADSSGTLQSQELEIDDETDGDDTSQMQSDIDFIKNFDARHNWEKVENGSTGHFFVDLELDIGVYTPPEDFISLASLEEEANRALVQSNPASPRRAAQTPARGSISSPAHSTKSSRVNSPMLPNSSPASSPRKFSRAAVVNNTSQSYSPSHSVTSTGSGSAPTSVNNHHGVWSVPQVSNTTTAGSSSHPVSPAISKHSTPPHQNHSPVIPAAGSGSSETGSKLSLNSPTNSGNGFFTNSSPPPDWGNPSAMTPEPALPSHGFSPAKSLHSSNGSSQVSLSNNNRHTAKTGGPMEVLTMSPGKQQRSAAPGSSNGCFVIDFDSSSSQASPTQTSNINDGTIEAVQL